VEQTVEIFCGQEKTFSSIAGALGFKTFTIDKDPTVSPNLLVDILGADASELPSSPLMVWAAPPDSAVFSDRKHWESDGSFHPATSEAETAMALVRRTINLTTAMNPTWWFLEHPRSLLRGMPTFAGFNRGYPTRNRLTFRSDEWGGKSGMEVDVWTNAYWWLPRAGDRNSEKGSQTGRRVPPFAISTMFEQLEQYRTTGKYGPR
jgi:hypothetical protein